VSRVELCENCDRSVLQVLEILGKPESIVLREAEIAVDVGSEHDLEVPLLLLRNLRDTASVRMKSVAPQGYSRGDCDRLIGGAQIVKPKSAAVNQLPRWAVMLAGLHSREPQEVRRILAFL